MRLIERLFFGSKPKRIASPLRRITSELTPLERELKTERRNYYTWGCMYFVVYCNMLELLYGLNLRGFSSLLILSAVLYAICLIQFKFFVLCNY